MVEMESSTEAAEESEFMRRANVVREAQWLAKCMEELGLKADAIHALVELARQQELEIHDGWVRHLGSGAF